MVPTKYPKTFHLSWSENLQNDDRMLPSEKVFENKNVIVSFKLDGESTSMYNNAFHARSLDSQHHPSRNWAKSLWGSIKHLIPDNIRICGENLFATHSIFYQELPTFFFVFGIYQTIDGIDTCLSWKETQEWCDKLGLEMVPTLYEGVWNEEEIKKCFTGKDIWGNDQEGYVVRNSERFTYDTYGDNVAKFVRKNHVQTDEHWLRSWKPNKMKV